MFCQAYFGEKTWDIKRKQHKDSANSKKISQNLMMTWIMPQTVLLCFITRQEFFSHTTNKSRLLLQPSSSSGTSELERDFSLIIFIRERSIIYDLRCRSEFVSLLSFALYTFIIRVWLLLLLFGARFFFHLPVFTFLLSSRLFFLLLSVERFHNTNPSRYDDA